MSEVHDHQSWFKHQAGIHQVSWNVLRCYCQGVLNFWTWGRCSWEQRISHHKFTKDLKSAIDQLVLAKVFDGESHSFHLYKKKPLLQTLNWTTITKWIRENHRFRFITVITPLMNLNLYSNINNQFFFTNI